MKKDLLWACLALGPFLLTAQCPELLWSDEFDGDALDETKWSYQLGDGCDISPDLCGWGNNELQFYRSENVSVAGGHLRMSAKRENVGGRSYTSARIRTLGKGDWTYGRFEASIKLPAGQGLWPAFWMLPTDEVYGGWPQSGEIDIMELIGSEPSTVHGTIHFGQPWPNNAFSGAEISLQEGTFEDSFHEFAVEWEPGEIRWMLDGYQYSRKTPSDLSGSRWPFDQDFHLLLNLAVGGNWPGSPNSSTAFPQDMVVDYVRVYGGNAPALHGDRRVAHQAEGVTYQVRHASEDASYTWSLPPGAQLVEGAGSPQATIDFGTAGGELAVVVQSACATDTLRIGIEVEEPYGRALILENFEGEALINYSFSTGSLTDGADNPAPDAVNGSPNVGRYTRDAGEQYDVLTYTTQAIEDADDFPQRERKFFMDLYTDAPVGTQVLLQLEDGSRAEPTNYPTGRHSRYEAETTVQDAWERLEFTLIDEPDPAVAGGQVDQLIFLFASNSSNGSTYYFDNLEVFERGLSTGLFHPIRLPDHLRLFPNPSSERLNVQYVGSEKLVLLEVVDPAGRVLRRKEVALRSEETTTLSLVDLPVGNYFLRGMQAGGIAGMKAFVVSP